MIEFNDVPTEQTTAVTDLLLAAVAFAGVAYLVAIGGRDPWKARVWAFAFAALGIAASLGAVVHGFVLDLEIRDPLWAGIHLALGTSVALFVVAAVRDHGGELAARRLLPALLAVSVVFFVIVRLYSGAFVVFLIYEAIAMLLALMIYTHLTIRGRLPGAEWMVWGILLTLAASAAQASKLRPFTLVWEFDHNGAFHLLQTVALFFLLAGIRAALAGRRP